MLNENIYCGCVTEKLLDQTIEINGWIRKIRKMGAITFLDIADRYGIVQVILKNNCHFELTRESVVNIKGKVVLRKNPNKDLATGKIEIIATNITLLSKAKVTPFVVDDNFVAFEDVLLKHRYLDLRRSVVQKKIIFRSKFIHALSNYLIEKDFIHIETPILAKPTPEGARDYLVPTRNGKNMFYALPQSPQIFKQLLMVAGFLKYFQIAKCFRDEDLRADRQPEFTQLDIEMSFIDEDKIMSIVEDLLKTTLKKTMGIALNIPFMRMKYEQAMNFYGSDKPDLRYDLKLVDLTTFFQNSDFNAFKKIIAEKQVIKGFFVNDIIITNSNFEQINKYVIDKGLSSFYFNFKNKKCLFNPLDKKIEKKNLENICQKFNFENGSLIISYGPLEEVNEALGACRIKVNDLYKIANDNNLCFVWIIDWPLFEYNKQEKTFVAAHHPFTSPAKESLATFTTDKVNAKARAYDLVLNGYEIGGGSIRITDFDIQQRMFEAINLTPKQIQAKFGYLLDAFKYGVPPHGGIALGLDRLIMLLTKSKSIKEIIAFPKNSHGIDLMLNAPSQADPKNLDDLFVKIK